MASDDYFRRHVAQEAVLAAMDGDDASVQRLLRQLENVELAELEVALSRLVGTVGRAVTDRLVEQVAAPAVGDDERGKTCTRCDEPAVGVLTGLAKGEMSGPAHPLCGPHLEDVRRAWSVQGLKVVICRFPAGEETTA